MNSTMQQTSSPEDMTEAGDDNTMVKKIKINTRNILANIQAGNNLPSL